MTRYTVASGIGGYDLSAWSEPPPKTRTQPVSPAGVGTLVQYGHGDYGHGRPPAVQEVTVGAGDFDVLLFQHSIEPLTKAWIDGAAVPFRPSDAGILFLAGQSSRWLGKPTVAPLLHFHIPTAFRARAADYRAELDGPPTVAIAGDSPLAAIGTHLLSTVLREDACSGLMLESYAYVILDLWSGLRSARPAGHLAGWQVRLIRTRLQDELDREVALDELADLVGLSPSYLCTAFRRTVGVPPHQFQKRLRVQRACELLLSSAQSVTEVALCVGYADPGHFTKVFRAMIGVTPTAWRRIHA